MKEAFEKFENYTAPYQRYGSMIELKRAHTKRVVEFCKKIAESEKKSPKEVEIACLCGLLHDIGRFEQWKTYQNFSDLETIDHGDLGVDILKENQYIDAYTKDKKEQEIILKAVKYHNKYEVPKTLTEEEMFYIDITRDADKLDILQLVVTEVFQTTPKRAKMSSKVYNCLKNKMPVRRVDIKNKSDRFAIRLGFIFDFNFKYSYEFIKKNHYIDKIIDLQLKETKNVEFQKQLEELRVFLTKYIEEKITC